MRPLASSSRYRISHDYETVWLDVEGRDGVVVGDFYGDPHVAIIDDDEAWCAIGGTGLIIYFLEEPFERYEYDKGSNQFREYGRLASDRWQVEAIQQTGASEIQVVLESGISHNIAFERTGR